LSYTPNGFRTGCGRGTMMVGNRRAAAQGAF
jgi:hypothetical protein